MKVIFVCCLTAVLAGAQVRAQPKPRGKVTLPLTHWSQLLKLSREKAPAVAPPVGVAFLDRSVKGVFRRGMFSGTLVSRFTVLEDRGHVRVPVIDGAAFLAGAQLGGTFTTLLQRHGMYTVGVDRPGTYVVKVRFFVGHEQDSFARRLQARLPAGGITRLSIVVPERPIEARLARGALTAQTGRPGETLLEGYLDASGRLDLSWTRRLTHRSGTRVKMEGRVNSLFTIHEALISGVTVLDLDILEGEADRIDLRLPPRVEVLRVTGDAVLQWKTGAKSQERLVVLLRYLARGQTRIAVHFQFPAQLSRPVSLPVILPPRGVSFSGVAGVLAPAGLKVTVKERRQAKLLTLRDLPPELTSLTRSPIHLGFSFSRAPGLMLSISRHRPVALTSTLIDQIQAATVITGQGSKITKLKLNIRNNTRQYLSVRLPDGAELTHALIDGQPVRPAVAKAAAGAGKGGRQLLFSLRQSERIEPGVGRVHRVKGGETLGDIAHFYFSDPARWPRILEHNSDKLSSERDLRQGQLLKIPSVGPVTVEESSFVLELSYEQRAEPLPGHLGRVDLRLPELDVDAMKVIWHLYLPRTITPLRFDGNLTQLTARRYGPLRRGMDYMRMVLSGRKAWAGAGKYTSILTRRKQIFREEAKQRGRGEAAPMSFPLVGQRYRFKRLLSKQEQPTISIRYAARWLVVAIRRGCMALSAGLLVLLLSFRRSWWAWLAAAVGVGGLLVLAHYFPGVHRRLIWGAALGLAALLAVRTRRRWSAGHAACRLRRVAWSPWMMVRLIQGRNLLFTSSACALIFFALSYPLLLSSLTAATLMACWWRGRGAGSQEASHADS